MNNKNYQALNGEHLMHVVWIEENGRVRGISDQINSDIAVLLCKYHVVKIECQGYTIESKARECARWGCE